MHSFGQLLTLFQVAYMSHTLAYKINLDAFYFGELESENVLVHVDPAVIKAMAAFVFIAIFKDILVGAYMHLLYEGTGNDYYNHGNHVRKSSIVKMIVPHQLPVKPCIKLEKL